MALLLQFLLLTSLLLLPLCHCTDPVAQYCDKGYPSGSHIGNNINHVMSDLVAKASVGGFAVSSYGTGNDTVYGLAQCRGDVSSDDCAKCLVDALKQLPVACPKQADARLWYDYCFMRYDTDNFVGQSDTGFVTILYNVNFISDNPDAFDKAVSKVQKKANADAVSPGSGSLGREKSKFTDYTTIYALAQCTRDLQPLQCAQCLSSTFQYFPYYCSQRQGCRVLYTSCMVRYEIYPFFFPLDAGAKNPAVAAAAVKYSKAIIHP